MQILEVIPQKRHLVKLLLSNGSEALLDKGYVGEKCIKAGNTVSEEELLNWIYESDYTRAKSRALWFLNRADHSEKALYDKLLRADIPPKACAQAIARLKELGLLNDVRYAERLATRLLEGNVSHREAYAKMVAKGLPRDIVNNALDGAAVDEGEQLLALIDKKYKIKLQNPENTQKVYAALVRKGFSYGAVRDALKSYNKDLENYDV